MTKLRFFRCHNPKCAGQKPHDFWGDAPVCNRCGGTDKDKRSQVTELTITHFDAGDNKVACDPDSPWRCSNKENMSGAPDAVTCPMCMSTPAWVAANDERGDGVGGIRLESAAWEAHKERIKGGQ